MTVATTTTTTLNLFVDHDTAWECVRRLAGDNENVNHTNKHDNHDATVAQFAQIIDKYLECPTVLDATLEDMVQHLAQVVLREGVKENAKNNKDNTTWRSLSALYALCKVRGYKTVVRCLPHTVDTVQPLWIVDRGLRPGISNGDSSHGNFDPSDNHHEEIQAYYIWQARYVVRLWWSALAALPFGVHVFMELGDVNAALNDSSDITTDNHRNATLSTLLADTRSELDEAGPLRTAAAVCLAAWYSRPDLDGAALQHFVVWAQDVVSDESSACRLMGVLQTLCALVKSAAVGRTRLLELFAPLWEPLWRLGDDHHKNLLRTKFLQKWWARMAHAHLPPVQRSPQLLFPVPNLVEDVTGRLLEGLAHDATVVRWSAAKGLGRLVQVLPQPCADDVVDALLELLSTSQKSNNSADHQVWHGVCLTLAELARRGQALAPHRLSEVVPYVQLALQYDQPRTTAARQSSSIGAHVRDAACYTVWAWARAYAPDTLRPHVQSLATTVLLVALLDREVNCRRAASAAFQEVVGRQGSGGALPHGIAILTVADFFALGNRTQSFTTISHYVAQFEEYRAPMLEELYRSKLFHWDIGIRKLAAQSLALLSSYDPVLLGEQAFPFLLQQSLDPTFVSTRHGAVLGVAELTKAFAEQDVLTKVLSEDDTRKKLIALVDEIDKRRLYRGRGGESMRAACCRLVECISLSKLSLTVKEQVKMLDTVDASITHPSEEVSICACIALGRLMTSYFPVGEKGPTDRLQARVVDKFVRELRTSQNVAVTRGYALALGYLPAKLLAPSDVVLGKIFVALRETARPDARVANEGDAETRRNALFSFTKIVDTLQSIARVSKIYPTTNLNEKHVKGILNVYLNSLEDYNTDRRGDVGSWCRMAAMSGLTAFLTTNRPSPELVDWCSNLGTTPTIVAGSFMKQMGEKLDAVRLHAGACLKDILNDNSLSIQHKDDIPTLLGLDKIDQTWADPQKLFTNLLRIALLGSSLKGSKTTASKPYFDPVLSGIIVTAGGLASATGKAATRSLTTFAKSLSDTSLNLLCELLLSLLRTNPNQARVTLPVLKCLEELLLHQCLDNAMRKADATFSVGVLECLEHERISCTDVKRLMLTADVTAALVRCFDSEHCMQRQTAGLLCSFLGSAYPRLRAHASQLFYLALLDSPYLVSAESNGDVLDVLDTTINTPWGTDMSMDSINACVSDIAEKLNVEEEVSRLIAEANQNQ